MTDPFAQFMEHWAPSIGVSDAFLSWLAKQEAHYAPLVMSDIDPFVDNTGTYISGRTQWRNHLKQTGSIEYGPEDIKKAGENHFKRRQEYEDRIKKLPPNAPITPSETARPVEMSQAARRVLERLDGRPAPDRKTLIQIAIEERMRK